MLGDGVQLGEPGSDIRHPCRFPMPDWLTLPERFFGSCHCGAVRFTIVTTFPELTTCDCSICRRKNALMVKVPEADFELLQGADALTEYQFHPRTARHFFCRVCGIYPFHRKRVTPQFFGVNVFCLEDFDPSGVPVRATDGRAMI